ncbi:hypothetical protein NFI96_014289 [Prochilodus magdalenae]|nr:hypothetical protein NFI96_014289 [Prochilodus magdalenae]
MFSQNQQNGDKEDSKVHCKTLQDVIDYLVMTTGGSLKPLIMEGAYEKNITFVDSNKENGEAIIVSTSSSPEPPVSLSALKPPKPGQRESVPSAQLENLYLEPSEIAEDQVSENVVTPPPVQPRVPVRPLPNLNCIPDGLTLSPGEWLYFILC